MLGIALEGGGAKGAFHMGAYKAFMEEGYEFSGIAGTSIGALNGAVIAQGDFEAGYNLWESMDNSTLFDIEEIQMQKLLNKKVDKEVLWYISSRIKNVFENRGLDTSKIRSIIEDIIDEKKLRDSGMDLGIVTVSISDLKPLEMYKEDIPKGKIVDYLLASANFPLFKLQPLDGKYYLDGAFYDNCPINLLARKGYKNIIAVRTLGMGLNRKIENENVNVINIYPSENLGRTLNFDNSQIKINLQMGYCDTMRMLKKLEGRKYYIRTEEDKAFFQRLISVPEDTIYKIGELMKLPLMEPGRLLFEKIIPSVAESLTLDNSCTYQQIMIQLMELLAEEREVDKYRILNFDSFINEIATSDPESNFEKTKRLGFLPSLRNEIELSKIAEEFLNIFIH